jgi:hypothetical protein
MDDNVSVNTEYGRVDSAQLEKLQSGFDTSRLLDALEVIDELRKRLCDPQQLRQELLDLHSMAHTIVNGTEMNVSSSRGPIWSKAASLEMELSEYADNLSAVAELIQELALLAPEYDSDDHEI